MCGIAGTAGFGDAGLLRTMTDTIAHRGPDGEGFYSGDGVHLGNRRLAIQDVPGGSQPMANEDGSVVVVYNGEIYNYPELRERVLARGHKLATHCDTEVLPHLYEDEGIDFAARLNGIFAFALLDRAKGKLFLVRDPLGVKPLVYAVKDGKLAFGSEAKAVLASGLVSPEHRRDQPAPVDERPLRAGGAHLLRRHQAPAGPGTCSSSPGGQARLHEYASIDWTPDPSPSTAMTGSRASGTTTPRRSSASSSPTCPSASRCPAASTQARSWPCCGGPRPARSRRSASASTSPPTRPATPGSWRRPSRPSTRRSCCTSRPWPTWRDAIWHTRGAEGQLAAALPAAPVHRRERVRGAVRPRRGRAVRRLRLLQLPAAHPAAAPRRARRRHPRGRPAAGLGRAPVRRAWAGPTSIW